MTILDASTGSFKYVPDANYTGSDSFTFQVSDGIAASAVVTESATVTAPPSTGGKGGGAFPLVLSVLPLGFAAARRRN